MRNAAVMTAKILVGIVLGVIGGIGILAAYIFAIGVVVCLLGVGIWLFCKNPLVFTIVALCIPEVKGAAQNIYAKGVKADGFRRNVHNLVDRV